MNVTSAVSFEKKNEARNADENFNKQAEQCDEIDEHIASSSIARNQRNKVTKFGLRMGFAWRYSR